MCFWAPGDPGVSYAWVGGRSKLPNFFLSQDGSLLPAWPVASWVPPYWPESPHCPHASVQVIVLLWLWWVVWRQLSPGGRKLSAQSYVCLVVSGSEGSSPPELGEQHFVASPYCLM